MPQPSLFLLLRKSGHATALYFPCVAFLQRRNNEQCLGQSVWIGRKYKLKNILVKYKLLSGNRWKVQCFEQSRRSYSTCKLNYFQIHTIPVFHKFRDRHLKHTQVSLSRAFASFNGKSLCAIIFNENSN